MVPCCRGIGLGSQVLPVTLLDLTLRMPNGIIVAMIKRLANRLIMDG